MNKIRLLTRAHFRKNRGISIGLLCLVLIASMLISLSMLLYTDAYATASKEAVRHNAGDGIIRITSEDGSMTEERIAELIKEDVKDYSIYDSHVFQIVSTEFADSKIAINIAICDRSVLDLKYGRNEIVEEDTSVKAPYVYLPYQFKSSAGYELGEKYSFNVAGVDHEYNIRGFIEGPYYGNNNNGCFQFIVDDDSYAKVAAEDTADHSKALVYELKEGRKAHKFSITLSNKIAAVDPDATTDISFIEDQIYNRSFLTTILAASMAAITVVILIIAALMITNSISNYIKENIKDIGILKAIGYSSSDIGNSLLLMFLAISFAGSVLGVLVSYSLMPMIGKTVVSQMGLMYRVSFSPPATAAAMGVVILFSLGVAYIRLRSLRKTEPMTALRGGVESHSFRKNHIKLSSSPFSLNTGLALKTMFFNRWQNIVTFFITGALVFVCVIGLLMYENFSRNPKIEMFSTEYFGGLISFDNETGEEAKEFLESLDGTKNVRWMADVLMYYNNEDALMCNAFEDVSKMNNVNVCYKGSLPRYDNEIAVSGKFALDYGLEIGDELRLDHGNESFTYLITGFIQTTNNGGREAIMSRAAMEHLIDFEGAPFYYYYDCDEETSEAAQKVIDACEKEYGYHVLSKINFYDIVEGFIGLFRGMATLMLYLFCGISAAVILLVLFLLIKVLIYSKRKDYGIQKALGYTTRDLVLQTAVSFMPSIILSVLISSVVSYFTVNHVMNFAMSSFGIIKANFYVPVIGVVLIGIFMIVISFLFAVLESRKIKNIEPYNMLVAE